MKAITLKLPDTLDHRLTLFAQAHKGLSKSEIVRQAIELFLDSTPQVSEQSAAVAARKWIGVVKGGPKDLSTNPAHMKYFGR
ncbi:MAG: CopG family transcriptional regulator [Burkholderiaceae bacterium]|nr:CopG family transcriptional regulator [Burkholderiaceae bacterium]